MFNKILLFCLIHFFFLQSAYGFDGQRQGGIIGIGGGIHHTYYTHDGFSDSYKSFATSVRAGYAFTNQFSTYYIRNASWRKKKNYYDDTNYHVTGISGIGASYYMSLKTPSTYLVGAIGIGDDTQIGSYSDSGIAYLVGVGSERTKGIHIELTYLHVYINNSTPPFRSHSFQAILNYLWY